MTEESRCAERHPFSHRRCTRPAGHPGQHEPERWTPEEMGATSDVLTTELMALVSKWMTDEHLHQAMVATLLAMALRLEVVQGFTPRQTLLSVLSCLADQTLTEIEVFKFCADTLGCSISEIRVPGGAKPS